LNIQSCKCTATTFFNDNINSGGNFTLDIDLSAGSVHNITAQATDVAGYVSDVSAVLSIIVDTTAY
jgi:hypothetical protein